MTDDYLCPNCCTPWKCNGPHIPEPAPQPSGSVSAVPVAWRVKYKVSETCYAWNYTEARVQDSAGKDMVNYEPLYTSPPPRKPWVGLNRNECMEIINRLSGQDWVYVVDAIEAKLKEKNT